MHDLIQLTAHDRSSQIPHIAGKKSLTLCYNQDLVIFSTNLVVREPLHKLSQ